MRPSLIAVDPVSDRRAPGSSIVGALRAWAPAVCGRRLEDRDVLHLGRLGRAGARCARGTSRSAPGAPATARAAPPPAARWSSGGIRSRSDCSTPASSSRSGLRGFCEPSAAAAASPPAVACRSPSPGEVSPSPRFLASGSPGPPVAPTAGSPGSRSGGAGPPALAAPQRRSGGLRDQPLGRVRCPVEPLLEPAQRVVLGGRIWSSVGLGGSLVSLKVTSSAPSSNVAAGRMEARRARGAA